MREQRFKTSKMNGLVVLLLFSILAICIMGVLLTGASAYQRLSERDNSGYERRTAAQYIATRVRHADRNGAVFVRDFEGERALILREVIDGYDYETMVDYHDGWLWELFVPVDSGFLPQDGIRLLELQDLEFQVNDGLLTAKVVNADGTIQELTLALRSGRGNDGYEE